MQDCFIAHLTLFYLLIEVFLYPSNGSSLDFPEKMGFPCILASALV